MHYFGVIEVLDLHSAAMVYFRIVSCKFHYSIVVLREVYHFQGFVTQSFVLCGAKFQIFEVDSAKHF